MTNKLKHKYVIIFFLLFLLLLLFGKAFNIEKKIKRAASYIDNGKFKEAIQLYDEIMASSSELDNYKKSRVFNNIGFCYYSIKKYNSAFYYYKKALMIDENYFLCLNNISANFIKQKRYKEAIPYLEKAYSLDDGYIKVLFNLAVVYINLRNRELAKSFLGKAFELDEDYTISRLKKNGITDAQIEDILDEIKKND